MNYNNKIIRGLFICIIVLSFILIINYNYIQNDLLDSFIISFISGAMVSLFMTYVQYKKEKKDAIMSLMKRLVHYYAFLDNLDFILSTNTKVDFEIAKESFDNYIIKNNDIGNEELNLISSSISSLYIQVAQKVLSLCSSGTLFFPYFLKYSKKNIQQIRNICKEQKKMITYNVKLINKIFGVDYPWIFKTNECKREDDD